MSKIRDALKKIAEAINELAEDKSLDEPVKVHVLSEIDAMKVRLMEETLDGRGGGVLIRDNSKPEGVVVQRLMNVNDARALIVKIKSGEVELA